VRFVRTPDRVLRERRKAMADPKRPHDITADAPAESSPHASAKAQRQPRGTTRAHFGQGIAPTESHIAQAWTLPSWLQPFASSPDVRFTRTPETIIRRQNLPHPRLPGPRVGSGGSPGAERAGTRSALSEPPSGESAGHRTGAFDRRRTRARAAGLWNESDVPASAPEETRTPRRGASESKPADFHRLQDMIRIGWAEPLPHVDQDNGPGLDRVARGDGDSPIAPDENASEPDRVDPADPWVHGSSPEPEQPDSSREIETDLAGTDLDLLDLPDDALEPRPAAPVPRNSSSAGPPVLRSAGPGRAVGRSTAAFAQQPYELPSLALLAEPSDSGVAPPSEAVLEETAGILEQVVQDFGVRGEIVNVRPGPVVTLYELEPAPGTKSSRVISLADDIARSMSAVSARVAVVQGRNAIGIELPNHKRETVYLRELLASQDFETSKHKLALCLGKTIGGEPVIADLARMPHLLVAGTTGSGKSVAINTMILSLVYRLKPAECRLIMVDPKMLELSVYDGIPHLLSPVVTDPKKAVVALKWAVREMEDRYKKMSKLGVRNIDGFNVRVAEAKGRGESLTRTVQTGFDRDTGEAVYEDETMDLEPLPYIVVIVDEMADLMMVAGKDIEGAIQRLAQMARAAGIHVILATQRPSVDVITGTIKANFPTRISFQVTSKIDSRTILGEMGAEQLLGQGDMLYMAGGGRITRVHGPFCSDEEVEKVVAHLKRQGRPQYLEAVTAGEDDEGGEGEAVFEAGEFGAGAGTCTTRRSRWCCATRRPRRPTSSAGCRSATTAPPRSWSAWKRTASSDPPTTPENATSSSKAPKPARSEDFRREACARSAGTLTSTHLTGCSTELRGATAPTR